MNAAPNSDVLRCCAPRPLQQRNNTASGATGDAHGGATVSLKALARQWIERNDPCTAARNTPETGATNPATAAPASATEFDLAERAAIVQEGAGVPADWAEGFASLEARPVPRGVTQAAWLAMMDAAGRFLDRWGAKAAALGWRPGELFGLDANAPMNRLDRRGAAFFLVDAEVIALTANVITIRRGGATQSIYRREGVGGPAWEAAP